MPNRDFVEAGGGGATAAPEGAPKVKPPDAPDATVAPLVPLVAPFVAACDGEPKVNPDVEVVEVAPEGGAPKENPPGVVDGVDVVVPLSPALEDDWDVAPKNDPNPLAEVLVADEGAGAAGAGVTPEGAPNMKPVGAAGAAAVLLASPLAVG